MSFLEIGQALGGQDPTPKTYGVYRVQAPPRMPGARDGSFSVPARGVPRLTAFDTRGPLLNVSAWTPWGWESRVPGSTLEKF